MKRTGALKMGLHAKKKKSLMQKLWKIFTSGLTVLVILMAMMLAGVRLLGFTPYTILSDSMAPKYQAGDLVYVKNIEPEKLKEGDVITFVANDNLTLVTHRINGIDRENRLIYTKGDANSSQDASAVLYENVVGVVSFSLSKLGYISNYLSSDVGKYVGIAAVLTLVLMMILPELFRKGGGKSDEIAVESENTQTK